MSKPTREEIVKAVANVLPAIAIEAPLRAAERVVSLIEAMGIDLSARRETLQLKYHEIQSTALDEIKEMIATRKCGQDLNDEERRELVEDIDAVAAFASTISLTNPHYDGYAMVEQLKFDPKRDILSQVKQEDA